MTQQDEKDGKPSDAGDIKVIPVVNLPAMYRIDDTERAAVLEAARLLAQDIGKGGVALYVRLNREQLALLTMMAAVEDKPIQQFMTECFAFIAEHEFGVEWPV